MGAVSPDWLLYERLNTIFVLRKDFNTSCICSRLRRSSFRYGGNTGLRRSSQYTSDPMNYATLSIPFVSVDVELPYGHKDTKPISSHVGNLMFQSRPRNETETTAVNHP